MALFVYLYTLSKLVLHACVHSYVVIKYLRYNNNINITLDTLDFFKSCFKTLLTGQNVLIA